MDRNYDVITLFKNTVILRRPGVAIFADIIKIITRFIKKIFKVSGKVKRIRNYVSKWDLCLYFLISQNFLISGKKNSECVSRVCHVIDIFFGSSLGEV